MQINATKSHNGSLGQVNMFALQINNLIGFWILTVVYFGF